ncbi:uncharacterized protein BP5553_10065 [Venustampulla echinocandica]|uniref:Glutamine amidotransferase domain-containing protein n=1 Tax=Venustampulla echinocandica TaxID=2656787 RepID=A0A370TAB3_9HELO|nr:uncharacterized protein BP5553_10065 [Venustampulla echinocandica]RDL30720.1 hypothetical protein BP5553_10065 [Venustampulla echinocandica]
MPSPPLRIAILECDHPPANARVKFGHYGGVFTSLLNSAAATLTPPPALQISRYDVVTAQEYPPLDAIDAILITGSRFTAFESDPWILKLVDFVKSILAQDRIRIIGVCFGHQILARALGAPVHRSPIGWEISVVPLTLTPVGKKLFGVDKLAIHQMHRDVVGEYPEGVEKLAYTDTCPVQGMYVKNRFITVQGHPEFTEEIVRELLAVRHESGIFDGATFGEGMGRVADGQDGVVVARAFLKFLLED